MSIEAMEQALEALETPLHAQPWGLKQNAIVAIRAAIEQAEKPVCEVLNERGEVDYISYVPPVGTMLYAAPRQWIGLTEEDWKQIWDEFDSLDTENDFQDYMAGKYGAGHYTDAGMYWQFQQQMIEALGISTMNKMEMRSYLPG
jgi:hypothetical protein